jgi:hypothetical protein
MKSTKIFEKSLSQNIQKFDELFHGQNYQGYSERNYSKRISQCIKLVVINRPVSSKRLKAPIFKMKNSVEKFDQSCFRLVAPPRYPK